MAGKEKDPGTAALISAIFPGGGQFYVGKVGSGVVSCLAFWYFLIAAIRDGTAPGGGRMADGMAAVTGILAVIIWAANIFDAHKEAGKHNAKLAQGSPEVASASAVQPPPVTTANARFCAHCGAPLAGRFCSACGKPSP